jgi:hypothetical protein
VGSSNDTGHNERNLILRQVSGVLPNTGELLAKLAGVLGRLGKQSRNKI